MFFHSGWWGHQVFLAPWGLWGLIPLILSSSSLSGLDIHVCAHQSMDPQKISGSIFISLYLPPPRALSPLFSPSLSSLSPAIFSLELHPANCSHLTLSRTSALTPQLKHYFTNFVHFSPGDSRQKGKSESFESILAWSYFDFFQGSTFTF